MAGSGDRFSVWNQSLGAFDYYESSSSQPTLNVEKPTHLVPRQLGATVDQAAWPLPGNVRKIGSGTNPIGKIARAPGAAMGDDGIAGIPLSTIAIGAGIAFVVWKYGTKRKGRR